MSFKKVSFFLVVVTMAVLIAACGGTSAEEGSDESSEEFGDNVVIDGSGTVYPLMSRLAEEYMVNEQPDVSVEVSRAGTSAGFDRFLEEDGTDFNDASRPIAEDEQAAAEELGFEPMELKVALDGLTMVIHPDNDWATEMTEQEVIDIFLADSDVTTWDDVNSEWPDEEISKMGPNENHGTYEFFYEEILNEQDLDQNTNLQQEYSTLVNLVGEDVNGIAFFGFGYYVNNQDDLQAVSIDFGDGPVEPSLDTIDEEGDYADFTRPVFTYLNVENAKEKPQVLDYALYIVNNANDFAGETGFAPIPEDEIQELAEELEALQ
ncbi:phosphate transport system substrate-binding protein [Virgibacillus natechei]|uniref:Phosphate-binding protein n=1 Tax=Virgibacillus natechei TaxID=1216297 RepID=A0ABS4IJS0_9BACI|nr:PstS family phosphate ABC transporter substrate-binding protein [Virgibacillus natechei]MBP1970254.1 phosphate transport system substrate-binding protein [Virgibacillus natechei]UZD12800.1 PstS family phosphate ABC transporter substrate-binding protein [Virgibacillus natechei]